MTATGNRERNQYASVGREAAIRNGEGVPLYSQFSTKGDWNCPSCISIKDDSILGGKTGRKKDRRRRRRRRSKEGRKKT